MSLDLTKMGINLITPISIFFQVTGIEAMIDLNDKDSVIEFLKRLELPHLYTIREINTGIYAS